MQNMAKVLPIVVNAGQYGQAVVQGTIHPATTDSPVYKQDCRKNERVVESLTLKRKRRIRTAIASRLNGKSMQEIAQELGVTRQRVHQLLQAANRNGLIGPDLLDCCTPEVNIERRKFIATLRKCTSRVVVARTLGIPLLRVNVLAAEFGIDLAEIRRKKQAARVFADYNALYMATGVHPTTTEMYQHKTWHAVLGRIQRIHGSIAAFREQYGIPTPARKINNLSDKFNCDCRRVIDVMVKNGSITRTEIMRLIPTSYSRASKIAVRLLAEGKGRSRMIDGRIQQLILSAPINVDQKMVAGPGK